MQILLGRIILWYLIFVGIPSFLAKDVKNIIVDLLNPKIKARLNEELKLFPKENVQKFPDSEYIWEATRIEIDNLGRTGRVELWFVKIVVVDFAAKVVIGSAIGATIEVGTSDNSVGTITKYVKAIFNAPAKKFLKFVNKLKGIKSK